MCRANATHFPNSIFYPELHGQARCSVEDHHTDRDKNSHDDAKGIPVFFVFFVEQHNKYIMLTDIRYILYDK